MKYLRLLLLPFSLLYGLLIWLRNLLYDKGILKSTRYDFPVVAIGNLSLGGTGKTPMTVYVLQLLKEYKSVGMLSRGYRRKSKGLVIADETTKVEDLGDEPYQIYHNFSDVTVAVDADRRNGVAGLGLAGKLPEVLVLDDAFQHRKVNAGFYMLLTTYDELYCDDFIVPAGNLRDTKNQAKRADCIVVTKCPDYLSDKAMLATKRKVKYTHNQPVYFTKIAYSQEVLNSVGESIELLDLQQTPFTLVTGIAKPEYLVRYLQQLGLHFEHLDYPDHHDFTTEELQLLNSKDLIITTEKDFVRLSSVKFNKLYYLPIQVAFLNKDQEKQFQGQLIKFVVG